MLSSHGVDVDRIPISCRFIFGTYPFYSGAFNKEGNLLPLDEPTFAINFVCLVIATIPKLPFMHKVRPFGDSKRKY